MNKKDPLNLVKELLVDKNIQFYLTNKDDFNRGCLHIVNLIKDSYLLYTNDSFASAVFLSITIIEEVTKLHIGLYRKKPLEIKAREKKVDGLFNHKKKHILATIETIKMSAKLNVTIGDDIIEKFINQSQNGDLLSLRESALYCDVVDSKFTVPLDVIDKSLARIMLLIAIEVWDDTLVGYSKLSLELSEQTDRIFELLK